MRAHRGRWTPRDRAASIYQYVPFDVPPGAPAVTVRMSYDRSKGPSAVLDLGLFDEAGFRGYSGGARSELVVTPTAATPGYLPGPIAAGEWRVLLGLHRVPPEGVDFRVEVDVSHALPADEGGVQMPPADPRPPRSARELPATAGRRWLAGDLHAHTIHSDGALTIAQLARLARARGLDFLAVTDHNTISHHPHLAAAGAAAGVLLLPGQEVTTDTGHANCFGDVGWVDFREPSLSWRAHAETHGGLLSVNHPLAGDCAWRRPLPGGTPLVEVWHSTWDRRPGGGHPRTPGPGGGHPRTPGPLEWWRQWGGIAVGGSDWHRPGGREMLGAPTTWAEVGEDGVLAALGDGRVALSASPDGPALLPHEDALVADRAEGLRLVDADGASHPVRTGRQRLPRGTGPHLLLNDHDRVQALSW